MALREGTALRATMHNVVGRRAVNAHAKRLGVVKRDRKVIVFWLVWTLILGFQVGAKRTIEGLRQTYERAAGQSLVRSAFYDRLTPSMAKLLYRMAQDVLAAQMPGMRMPTGSLSAFTELLAIDSTVLRLRDLLAPAYEASRTNHTKAAAKLHVVMNVTYGAMRRVKLTSERVGDTIPWRRVGKWVCGKLLLFDLGYYSFHLFDRIDANGGFFLSRVKSNFDPVITAVNRKWRGRAVEVVGRKLRDVLPLMEREVLDVSVPVKFQTRSYRGHRRYRTREFRLVAVRNVETGGYHCYLTNVPADMLPAEEIAQTYALRWQVELLFLAMKTHGHLEQLPSGKRCVVECLVWASVLQVLVSQELYRLVRKAVALDRFMPALRWATLMSRLARDLLEIAIGSRRSLAGTVLEHLVAEAPDPNIRRRKRAFDQVPVLAGG